MKKLIIFPVCRSLFLVHFIFPSCDFYLSHFRADAEQSSNTLITPVVWEKEQAECHCSFPCWAGSRWLQVWSKLPSSTVLAGHTQVWLTETRLKYRSCFPDLILLSVGTLLVVRLGERCMHQHNLSSANSKYFLWNSDGRIYIRNTNTSLFQLSQMNELRRKKYIS